MLILTFSHHARLSQSRPAAGGSSCVFPRLQCGSPEARGQHLLLLSSCHLPTYPERLSPYFHFNHQIQRPNFTHSVQKTTKKMIMRIHNKTKFTSQQSKFMFIRLQETAYNYLFSKQCCCCFFLKQISV